MNPDFAGGGAPIPPPAPEPVGDRGDGSGRYDEPWWAGEWIVPGIEPEPLRDDARLTDSLRSVVRDTRGEIRRLRHDEISGQNELKRLSDKLGVLSKQTTRLERLAKRAETVAQADAVVRRYRSIAQTLRRTQADLSTLEGQSKRREKVLRDDEDFMQLITLMKD